MQCTLLIPNLFWHRYAADAVQHGLALPALTTLLARASVERYPALTPEAWLCQAFEVERQHDWPVAPLTLTLDGREAADNYWLRADPVHIKVSREGLHLVDSALFELSIEDALALVERLNAHFGDQHIAFEAPHPKRWYAKVARSPDLVTRSISEVAGRDVQSYLPTGRDALAWHGMFNEAQMLLHDHPVNEARAERNEADINSVWFWGGGTLPAVPGRHFDSVRSDGATAIALAAAADTHGGAVPASAAEWLASAAGERGPTRSHLVVLDELDAAVRYDDADGWRTRIAALETRWFAPLAGAVRNGRLAQLTLVALGERAACRFTLRRGDLLKLWRRPKALSAYA
jgi:hypothetical protein